MVLFISIGDADDSGVTWTLTTTGDVIRKRHRRTSIRVARVRAWCRKLRMQRRRHSYGPVLAFQILARASVNRVATSGRR